MSGEPCPAAADERSAHERTSRRQRPAAAPAGPGRVADHPRRLPLLRSLGGPVVHRLTRGGLVHRSLGALDTRGRRVLRRTATPLGMTAGLLIAGVIIFAMVVAGVWLMQYAEAEPAARAVGRAPDAAEEQEARESLSTPRSSILVERGPEDEDRPQSSLGRF